MAERKHGAPVPPTTSSIRSEDWYARDLTGEQHTAVEFIDVDLTEASGRGASFTDCTFRDVRFNVSVHESSAFVGCTFVNCSFFDATFTGCKLVGSMFERCSYSLLKVDGGDWSFVGMPRADLKRVRLRGVRMREADLTGVRLQSAEVRDVDLSGSWLNGANLEGCDLRGSDLPELDPTEVELEGAIVTLDQAVAVAMTLGLDVRPDKPAAG